MILFLTVVTQQTFILMKTSWRRLEVVFHLCLQKTSWRLLQNVLIKTNMFAFALRLQKRSWRRLGQDQYIRLGHTSSRRLQDVLWEVLKTSQRRLQDVLDDIKLLRWRRVEDQQIFAENKVWLKFGKVTTIVWLFTIIHQFLVIKLGL